MNTTDTTAPTEAQLRKVLRSLWTVGQCAPIYKTKAVDMYLQLADEIESTEPCLRANIKSFELLRSRLRFILDDDASNIVFTWTQDKLKAYRKPTTSGYANVMWQ